MERIESHDGVTVIRPAYTPRADSNAPLHSAFNLLGTAKRASVIASLDADEAHEFSKPVTGGGVWHADEGYASVYVKAPGTDIYLPQELSQFEPAMRKIIEHNYTSGQTGVENRDGSEWAHLIVSQRIEHPVDHANAGVAERHLDMNVHEVVERGGWFKDERYVISDTPKMGTIFFDADTGLKEEDLLPLGKDHWDGRLKSIFDGMTDVARKCRPYDIAHFNSTTPHARENPAEPVRRTFLTLGFGHGYAPSSMDQIQNPHLLKAMQAQQSIASYSLRADLMKL